MDSSLDLLRKTFQTLGFTILPKNDTTFYAQRTDGSYLVYFTENPTTTTMEMAKSMTPAGWGCIVATGVVVDENLRRTAGVVGVYLWDREEIERQIGRAMLFEVDQKSPASPVNIGEPPPEPHELVQKPLPPPAESYDGLGEFFGASDKTEKRAEPIKPGDQWDPIKPWPTPSKAQSSPPVFTPEQSSPPVFTPGQSSPPIFTPDEHSYLSGEPSYSTDEPRELMLFSFPISVQPQDLHDLANMDRERMDMSLVFHPVWLLNYRIDKQDYFQNEAIDISGQGSLLLSALDGEIQPNPPVPPSRDITVPKVSYRVKEPVIKKDDALETALEEVIKRNTRIIRFKNTNGEAAVVEHRRFSPRPEDVRYSFELVYQPMWLVQGGGRVVEINATTGEPKYPVSRNDDVEIL